MRLLLASALVTAISTGPALGCPHRLLCVVQTESIPAHEVARVAKPAHVAGPRTAPLSAAARFTFDAPHRADPDELPWIWRAVREHVVSRLPQLREPDRFTLVLSPVVVTSPSDTVPGLGIAGNF